MNRYTTLHATPDLTVRRFDHPPHEVHEDPEREVAGGYTIAFVTAGHFDVIVGGERQRLRPGSALLTRPGLAFRCEHGESCPDDTCLSVAFEPEAVTGAEHAWQRAGWSARVTPTPRLAGVEARLKGAATRGDAFEMERWSLAALTSLAADSRDAGARGHYRVHRSDVEAVTATCVAIEADPTPRLSVAARARAVGLTSPQLTHAFRRYLGLSPHQYVVRWRLAAAARHLAGGASVSESCYRAGFENLSHFCRTFQRALGARPSAWRTTAPREMRRKVQDLLAGRS
jgi:AraC-like DNA-binding protein